MVNDGLDCGRRYNKSIKTEIKIGRFRKGDEKIQLRKEFKNVVMYNRIIRASQRA